jgi:hypothetical protein
VARAGIEPATFGFSGRRCRRLPSTPDTAADQALLDWMRESSTDIYHWTLANSLGKRWGVAASTELVVESTWGAVPGLLSVRFPRPLAEPAVPVSRQRALHGVGR